MLHSSNTTLRLTIQGASYDLPETLFYFESGQEFTVGLFECGTWPEIPVGERIRLELYTKNELVESLKSVFIIRREFTNPDYGNVTIRYVFSTDADSDWQIDPMKLDMIHYKSDRVYDYAVSDAVKSLNTTINNWTRNCTCGDETK